MGEVYRADDLELNQPVALKFLPGRIGASPADLDRFRKEVRIAREVSHPNVCRTYDISAVEGQVFLVMEYIDGEDLASVLRRLGRPSRDKALEIARQLCLGLGAAHERGVLHRDLKPANVMIDGRGRVRITDFGLAGLAEELSEDRGLAGTPGYIAPEQFAKAPASVQSDLYSLGLVLYELFTGKRAFESRDLTEIRRLQSDSSIRSPSSLVADMDPAVERVILRLLESDPRNRPASAYAVLAALPGGDPLAAALAAGETPSPELVASAGGAGSVRPAIAVACVLFVAASFAGLAITEQERYRGLARSATALAMTAEEVLAKAGGSEVPRYSYSGFIANYVYLDQRARLDSIAARGNKPKVWAPEVLYWRRWSPDALINPELHAPGPTLLEPPPQLLPGSATVLLDPAGRLVALSVVPVSVAGDSATRVPDWSALVSAAGFDPPRMSRVTPNRFPVAKTDSVTAWRVQGLGESDQGATLIVGSLHGRVVHFSGEFGWGSTHEVLTPAPSGEGDEAGAWFELIWWSLLPLVASVLLGLRNLRLGRGDRRGATRLAVFVFLAYMFRHLVTLNLSQEGLRRALEIMIDKIPIGHALLHGVTVWFMYVALEPYIRRLWPRVLVSWARLVSGRFRDPIIGRDILAGFVVAGLGAMIQLFAGILAGQFGIRGPISPSQDALYALTGPGVMLGVLAFWTAISVLNVMAFFTLLLILRMLLRRNLPSIVGAALLLGGLNTFPLVGQQGPAMATVLGATWVVGMAYLGLRFGLLAALVGVFVGQVLSDVPWTTDLSVWYVDRTLIAAAVLAVLLAYGFSVALGGRSIFKDLIQEPGSTPRQPD